MSVKVVYVNYITIAARSILDVTVMQTFQIQRHFPYIFVIRYSADTRMLIKHTTKSTCSLSLSLSFHGVTAKQLG